MGIGEVEDRAEREERKRKRDERRKRKQEKEERHRRKAALAATGIDVGDSNETVLGGIKRIRDKIAGDSKAEQHAHNTLSRRLRRNAVGAREEEIELQDVRSHEPAQEDDRLRVPGMEGGRQEGLETDLTAVSVIGADDARTSAGVVSNLGSGSSDTNPSGLTGASSARPGWAMGALRSILSLQPNFIKVRIKRLRLAHVAAAKVAATEQSALREQVLNNARGGAGPGLRSMMFVRTHGAAAPGSGPLQGSTPDGPRASLSHSPSAQARRSASASGPRPSTITSSGPSDSTGAGMGIGAGTSMTTDSGPPSLPRLRTHDTVDSASTRGTSTNLSGLTAAELTRRSLDERRRPSFAADREREREHERNPFRTSSDADWVEADDDEEEDDEDEEGKMEDDDEVDDEDAGRRSGGGRSRSDTRERDLGEDEGDSWYWRGGLRQMRLRDRTTYD